ncbi:Calcipressin [Penicillium coprophilum]|uniref:Calcipressin n=1 Tax=Penicillium coprophilum TaxID=36646 RepID=UPI00239A68A2|nr:Calcipressin [Penicillium coprophilum]KAJ5164487.1 Calcipressin [Penicillium coprophilum]
MATSVSPPRSLDSAPEFTSSPPSSSRPSLTLDIANMPALSQPTPPSNTLLITNLHDLLVFQPSALEEIRNQITAVAPLNSFSPLPSMRRIVCSFQNESDATAVRKLLDGKRLLNRDVYPRIYFGEPTAILDGGRPKLLEAPQVSKMFFISPPPSPPHGWVVRNEDPPNKEVHATDLAHALSKLNTDQTQPEASAVDPATPVSISSDKRTSSWPLAGSQQRSRSSTIIYNPEDHGDSPNLPAVMVEDMTLGIEDVDMDTEMSPIEMSVNQMPPKTSRPPIELME